MADPQTSMHAFRASLTAGRLHEALIRADAHGFDEIADIYARVADKAFDELVERMTAYRAFRRSVVHSEVA